MLALDLPNSVTIIAFANYIGITVAKRLEEIYKEGIDSTTSTTNFLHRARGCQGIATYIDYEYANSKP